MQRATWVESFRAEAAVIAGKEQAQALLDLTQAFEMVDHGKRVVFEAAGSYIEDVRSGQKEPIHRVGNSYEFTTHFWEEDDTKEHRERARPSGFPRQGVTP